MQYAATLPFPNRGRLCRIYTSRPGLVGYGFVFDPGFPADFKTKHDGLNTSRPLAAGADESDRSGEPRPITDRLVSDDFFSDWRQCFITRTAFVPERSKR